MILSDGTLRWLLESGGIKIDPPPTDVQIQPASVDVTLGEGFLVTNPCVKIYDPARSPVNPMSNQDFLFGEFHLAPGQLAMGTTAERLTLPNNIMARIEGCSSLGRIGLMIHSTAGFIDPGWDGQITLELKNIAPWTIVLRPEMRIGQLAFEMLDKPSMRPYGHPGLKSRYRGQTGPVASRERLGDKGDVHG